MPLEKYKQKRNPSVTPEPFGGKSRDEKALHFVVQKHAASRLHYDLRLEIRGVLKSWAVPKGPSIDPEIKRLAMMVEDHPIDYGTFEGIIPEGEYGGGTVIVWDAGTYEAAGFDGRTKKEVERHLMHGLHGGKLKIVLHGKKLKGQFALVKTGRKGENSWLLMKLKDKYAGHEDITLKEKSVQSGKTIEKVKATSRRVHSSLKAETTKKAEKKELGESVDESIKYVLKKASKSKMPAGIKPMLATLVDKPFDDPEWLYEVKWDGYRTLGFIRKGKAELLSRNNKSFTKKYYPIADSLEKWTTDAVIDGEILVINEKGESNFSALQNWRGEADGNLVMYVFDLLWYQGKNLMKLPLLDRLSVLRQILPAGDDRIRLSQVFSANGNEFFEAARKLGLEGIIAKRAGSIYTPDYRSRDWLKIKARKRQEVIIGGYTQNEGTSKKFSSLLLGVFENKVLQYVGKVGTGFTDKLQKELMNMFRSRIVKECPFYSKPDVNKPSRFRPDPPSSKVFWLKPELICEVSYTEVTNDGVFRHPSFKGLRIDKNPEEVTSKS